MPPFKKSKFSFFFILIINTVFFTLASQRSTVVLNIFNALLNRPETAKEKRLPVSLSISSALCLPSAAGREGRLVKGRWKYGIPALGHLLEPGGIKNKASVSWTPRFPSQRTEREGRAGETQCTQRQLADGGSEGTTEPKCLPQQVGNLKGDEGEKAWSSSEHVETFLKLTTILITQVCSLWENSPRSQHDLCSLDFGKKFFFFFNTPYSANLKGKNSPSQALLSPMRGAKEHIFTS